MTTITDLSKPPVLKKVKSDSSAKSDTKKPIPLTPPGRVLNISTEAEFMEWISSKGSMNTMGYGYALSSMIETLRGEISATHRYSYRNDLQVPAQFTSHYNSRLYLVGFSVPATTGDTPYEYIKNFFEERISRAVSDKKLSLGRDNVRVDLANMVYFDRAFYIPILIKTSGGQGPEVPSGCIRIELFRNNEAAILPSYDTFHYYALGGLGAVYMELLKDAVNIKVDTTYVPYVNVSFNNVSGSVTHDKVYLADSGITNLHELFSITLPRNITSYGGFSRSLVSILSSIRNLRCCTKEVAMARLGTLNPVIFPLAPVLIEAIRNDPDQYWSTENLDVFKANFVKAIKPTITKLKDSAMCKMKVSVDDALIPSEVHSKDKAQFINGFLSWNYGGISTGILIESGDIDTLRIAVDKYYHKVYMNKDEGKVELKKESGKRTKSSKSISMDAEVAIMANTSAASASAAASLVQMVNIVV